MANRKNKFKLETSQGIITGNIEIVGQEPKDSVYVAIDIFESSRGFHFIKDKDLERFAVNILKALKSKKLK